MAREVVRRHRERIRIGTNLELFPITVSYYGARSCAWRRVQSFPHTSLPEHLDQLPDLTDKAAQAVVTLKVRDNFNSEYM
jgi:hypothetical protein